MHPRTEELLRHLADHRAVLHDAVDRTPIHLREQRPSAERWSVAEVLEHLGIVEARVGKLLQRGFRSLQAEGRLVPLAATGTPALAGLDVAALLDRERRLAARENVQPSGAITAAEAWARLETSRAALRDAVLAADGWATDAIVAPHPFLGPLDFTRWIAFVGLHEARHAAQIREIAGQLARG